MNIDPGLPFPPQNVVVSVVENGATTVTVNVEWDPPNNDGVVDSYVVDTSPESATVRVGGTSSPRVATLVLFYNVRYTVRVIAESCEGLQSNYSTKTVEFGTCKRNTPWPCH